MEPDPDLWLVFRIADELSTAYGGRVEAGDLVTDGFYGLLRARRTWSPDGGASFRTWARLLIKRQIADGLRAYYGRHGRKAVLRFSEVSTRFDLDLSHREDLDTRLDVETFLALLPERERRILTGVDLEGRTAVAVGRELGLGEARMSQLRKQSLARLQAHALRETARGR
jgi:RNA polymerase sigma factor for flagellar operon FliA